MIEKAQSDPKRCQSLVTGRRQLDSDATFAKWLGVPAQTLDGWLKGNGEPSTPHLTAIAEKTDVVLDWLLLGYPAGDAPVLRDQWRTDKGLAADVAEHVRRALESEGNSRYAVDHYLPSSNTLLALAVEAARNAAVDEHERRRQSYMHKAQRIAFTFAERRLADPNVAPPSSIALQSSVIEWADRMATAGADPAAALSALTSAGCILPALAELLAELTPDDSPAIALVLKGESPLAFWRRLSGAPTCDEADTSLMEYRRSQPEARTYAIAAEWCMGQQWEKSPDRHFPGHTRWVWSGPNIANCAKVAGAPDKPGSLAS